MFKRCQKSTIWAISRQISRDFLKSLKNKSTNDPPLLPFKMCYVSPGKIFCIKNIIATLIPILAYFSYCICIRLYICVCIAHKTTHGNHIFWSYLLVIKPVCLCACQWVSSWHLFYFILLLIPPLYLRAFVGRRHVCTILFNILFGHFVSFVILGLFFFFIYFYTFFPSMYLYYISIMWPYNKKKLLPKKILHYKENDVAYFC